MPKKKSKTRIKLYIYECIDVYLDHGIEHRQRKTAVLSPSDEFTDSFFKNEYKKGWGNFERYEIPDGDGGFKTFELLDVVDFKDDSLLPCLDEAWEYLLKNPKIASVKELVDISADEFMEDYLDDVVYHNLSFHPKALVSQFKGLPNEKLDSLIMEIMALKKAA